LSSPGPIRPITHSTTVLDNVGDPLAVERDPGQINHGLCECGCCEKTTVSHKTDRSKSWIKGKPLRFKRGHATLGSKLAKPVDWGCVLNDLELGWVAGLIEGEGSFTVKKSKRKNGYSCQPQLRVSMTDEDVVRKLAALIPAGNVLKAGRRTEAGKEVWMWTLSKSQALIDLMIVLRPLMGKRRRKRIDFLLAHSGFIRINNEE
jgi:hypothetical protein